MTRDTDREDALPNLVGRNFVPELVPPGEGDVDDGVNRSHDLKCYPRPRTRVLARKFDDIKKQAYVEEIARGGRRVASCKAVGVGWASVWMAMKEDPEFAEAVSLAEILANEQVENAVYQSAVNGDVKAQQYWLNNRWPERWKTEAQLRIDAKVDVTEHSDLDSKFSRLADRMLADGDE